MSNYKKKRTLAYFPKNDPWAPRSCSAKFLEQLDTRLNHYSLISSQSMLIYHLNLKQLYLENGCSNRKNYDIFDPRGVEESLIGQF